MKVSIRQARERFSEIVNLVTAKGERVILTSRNKPKAVLVSLSDAEALADRSVVKARRMMQIERIRALRERLAARAVSSDSTETLRALREERLGNL